MAGIGCSGDGVRVSVGMVKDVPPTRPIPPPPGRDSSHWFFTKRYQGVFTVVILSLISCCYQTMFTWECNIQNICMTRMDRVI